LKTHEAALANNAVVEKEAEFQARIESRIRAAFPLMPAQIKLEHYLHLRLGHHQIIIDGSESDKSSTCGRYDVLVLVDDKPLLIAELKAPGIIVGEDDVKQALSYARLHDPMVPLVLVTNGENTIVRRTYDGEEIEFGEGSAENFTSILSSAATLAAAASEDAIRTLLGSSKDTWRQVFAAWNSATIAGKTGAVSDFRYPITREFSIPREAVSQLQEALSKDAYVVVLHGPPLCGVTNVLTQFAQVKSLEPKIFVDGKAAADVFQFIANRLSRELSFGVSKDDVRSWFNTGRGLANLVVIIDGFPKEVGDELIDYANAALLRLVIGMDSDTFRQCAAIDSRVEGSFLGRSAVPIELLPLSNKEFGEALDAINEVFFAVFFNGAQFSPDLRLPRTLRVIAATLPRGADSPVEVAGRSTRLMIDPIPGPILLERCSQVLTIDPKLKFDLQKLAKAFILDVVENIGDADWVVATWGLPSIDPDILEKVLSQQQAERLVEAGFLSWIDLPKVGPRLLVRVEELLAHHVAVEWAVTLAKLHNTDAIRQELEHLIRLASVIPAGDIALAAAVFKASLKNPEVLCVAIPYLIEQEPKASRLRQGARIELLLKDQQIRLNFGEGMDEEVIGNMLPWLVLSHLANFPMEFDGRKNTANASIFIELGASPHFLYQSRPTDLADMQGFHFHDIEGIGSFPCLAKTGIVEPLLQAMLNHAHRFPDELILLAKYALENKEAHLAWRLLSVAITAEDSTDKDVEKAAKGVKEVLGEWWGAAMKESFTRHRRSDALIAPKLSKRMRTKKRRKKKSR